MTDAIGDRMIDGTKATKGRGDALGRRLCGVVTLLMLGSCAGRRAAAPKSRSSGSEFSTARFEIKAADGDDSLAKQAAVSPLAFLKSSLAHYDRAIRDYRCRFLMQDGDGERLNEEQEIAIKFRENPYSVDMRWLRNSQGAIRISYVVGRFRQLGREFALVYPGGFFGAFTPNGVKLDIRSPQMLRGRERGVDGFGFRNTLARIIGTCERAKDESGYALDFLGVATLQGRGCIVFRRTLPNASQLQSNLAPADGTRSDSGQSESGMHDSSRRRDERPAHMLLIYMDREWLVPLGCFEYADDAGEILIGSFVTADVEMNVGLTDADF